MPTKYASQKQRFYTFHPGQTFQLDYDDLHAQFDSKCYLVALTDVQISVLQSMIDVFLRWQWVWGLKSPRSAWTQQTRDKWDEIEAFNASLEECLMSGCDLSFLNTHMAAIATTLDEMNQKMTAEPTLDDIYIQATLDDNAEYDGKDWLEMVSYLKNIFSGSGNMGMGTFSRLIKGFLTGRYRAQMIAEQRAQTLMLRNIANGIYPIANNGTDEKTLLGQLYDKISQFGWFKIPFAIAEPTPAGEATLIATLMSDAGEIIFNHAQSKVTEWFNGFIGSGQQVDPQNSIVGMLQEILRANGGIAGQHEDILTVYNAISSSASDNDILKFPNIYGNLEKILDFLPDGSVYRTDPAQMVLMLMLLDLLKRIADSFEKTSNEPATKPVTSALPEYNYKCNAARYIVGRTAHFLKFMSEYDLYSDDFIIPVHVLSDMLRDMGVATNKRTLIVDAQDVGWRFGQNIDYELRPDWVVLYSDFILHLEQIHGIIVNSLSPGACYDECADYLSSLYPADIQSVPGGTIDFNIVSFHIAKSIIPLHQLNRLWINDISKAEIEQYGNVLPESLCPDEYIPDLSCFPQSGSVPFGVPIYELYGFDGTPVSPNEFVTISSVQDIITPGVDEWQRMAVTVDDERLVTVKMASAGVQVLTFSAYDCLGTVLSQGVADEFVTVFEGYCASFEITSEIVGIGEADVFNVSIKLHSI